MRKEYIFAIVAGSILGLLIAFGIWRINSALSPAKEEVSTEDSGKGEGSIISIATPSENDVIGVSPASITGLTKPGAWVIVTAAEHDYLIVADNKGAFSQEVSLIGGVNQILVSSIDKNGVWGEQKLTIVYSTEFAQPDAEETEVTQSSDSIRQKVQEKVDQALNSPTAYMGTVTDISEGSIQLKSADDSIAQISSKETPTVIKDGTSPKTVKLTDIAIGDYIVAMGYRNGNHVLTAKRILISSQPGEIGKKVFYGNIASVAKAGLSLETKQGDVELAAPSTAIIYKVAGDKFTKIKLATLEEGNLVIAVSDTSANKNSARTVFLITAE